MATEAQLAQQKKRFLDAFAEMGNVSAATRTAKVPRRNVYHWLETDEAFALAYREAEVRATDAVDAEIRRRGVAGWEEPVYQGGHRVGTIRKFSDVLLIFLAKRLMPAYRETATLTHEGRVKHEHAGGIDLTRATDDELALLERLAARSAGTTS